MATLYGQRDNFRTQKVQAAAAYGNTKVTLKEADPPADKFPLGIDSFESPALEHSGKTVSGDAGVLWEVSGSALKGQSAAEASSVVSWLQLAETEASPAILGWVLPSVSVLKMDKKAVDAAKAATHEFLSNLNEILLSRTFLVGERLSLADLSLAFNLLPAFQHVLDAGERKTHSAVTRWFKTVMGQTEVAAVVGTVSYCSTPAHFDPKKFADNAPSPAKGKKEKKKSESDKKEKKKEKKKAEPEPKSEPEEEEEFAEPPKKGDPFDKFAKPKFNLDEFKRIYSNEDTETKAIPYFLENVDWENWSLWTGTYKFPEDLGLVFMSCNLISGMMQRLDKLRKNCFASIVLFGEDNKSTITGLWLWRGDELAFELSPDWQVDSPSYEWKKIDPKAESTKKLIKEYLMWEGDFDGKKFNQGKIFK